MIDDLRSTPYLAVRSAQPFQPPMVFAGMRALRRDFGTQAAPDLPSGSAVVIEQADAQPCLGGNGCGGHATGARAYDCEIELSGHSVTTSIPGAHNTWQVR